MLRPTGRRPPKQDRSAQYSRPADAGGSRAAGYLRISGQCNKCGETNLVTQTCRHEHSVSCFVLVSRATRANTIRRETRKEAGITRPCHVLKVECSTFGW